jgi:hypothetical protein
LPETFKEEMGNLVVRDVRQQLSVRPAAALVGVA